MVSEGCRGVCPLTTNGHSISKSVPLKGYNSEDVSRGPVFVRGCHKNVLHPPLIPGPRLAINKRCVCKQYDGENNITPDIECVGLCIKKYSTYKNIREKINDKEYERGANN